MAKLTVLVLFCLILLLASYSFIFAQEESITFTTYYPAPYGSYQELRSDRVAIGSAYRDVTANPLSDGNLIVSGNVGIGTNSPGPGIALDVVGGQIRNSNSGNTWNYVNSTSGTLAGLELQNTGTKPGLWFIWTAQIVINLKLAFPMMEV